MNRNELIDEIERKLKKADILRKDQLLEIAEDLLRLDIKKQLDKTDLKTLRLKFLFKLEKSGFSKIIDSQMRYAIRLATYPGELSYEEMHKLFSLCDTTYALEKLGIEFDSSLKIRFDSAIRNSLKKEKRKARMVAQDRIEDWKFHFWWYKV